MKRHKHNLSHYRLATFKMGALIPVSNYEVLPGDTIQQATSALVRVSPLNTPVMHPVSVRIHHWYVPYRLIWSSWQNFITGGPDGLNASVFPTVDINGQGKGTLCDYFGLPLVAGAYPVSALPWRAYELIWNEFYRDQDLQAAVAISLGDGVDGSSYGVQNVSWEKDYFTSARPWPQKGATVTLPLGTQATVRTAAADILTGVQNPALWRLTGNGNRPAANRAAFAADGTVGNTASAEATTNSVYPTNLYADLTGATAVDVNTVRRAFALQRYEEARALYGSRYTEYLRYLGIRSSDARLQRPEYLGGGKQTISFSEVLQTSVTTSGTPLTGVGGLTGHGIAALRSNRYRRFFEEHGIVMTLMSVRPRAMYVGGTLRMWNRRVKEDFWQKELELIGQQSVMKNEVWTDPAAPGTNPVFGYQNRFSEYHHEPSQVSGDFRDTLNTWHLGRIFAAAPSLNAAFVSCVPSLRINQDTAHDNLWVMVNNSIQARRLVRPTGVGRIV